MADNYINLPAATGTGTVTSVALTAPGILTVAGSPVTSSGTLALTLATQTANTVFAGGTSGGAATPAFRALVAADIPGTLTALTVSGATLIANAAASQATIGGASSTAVHVVNGGLTQTVRSISSNLTIDTTTKDNMIFADTSGGAFNLTLPTPSAGRSFKLIDTTNSFSTNNLTIVRNGSEKINNVAASKVLSGGGLIWNIVTDGTNWWVG